MIETFTIPGTHEWICPLNVTTLSFIKLKGAGANGVVIAAPATSAGQGGGGAGFSQSNNLVVTPGATYEIIIPAIDSGDPTIFRLASAPGTHIVKAASGLGRIGGLAADGVGDTKTSGADGGDVTVTGINGGAGGGGAGSVDGNGAVGTDVSAPNILGLVGGLDGSGNVSGGTGGNVP